MSFNEFEVLTSIVSDGGSDPVNLYILQWVRGSRPDCYTRFLDRVRFARPSIGSGLAPRLLQFPLSREELRCTFNRFGAYAPIVSSRNSKDIRQGRALMSSGFVA